MEAISEALQWISDWLDLGIFGFFSQLFKELVAWLVIAKIKFQLWALVFSWEVAKTVIFNLNLSQYIQTAWNSFDSIILGYLNFFRVPEAINILIQAYVTRLTLSVMGW